MIQSSVGWKQKFISYVRIALEKFCEKIDNIIEEAILLWKNETRYQFSYDNPSCYLSSASDAYCLITSAMFLNSKDVN